MKTYFLLIAAFIVTAVFSQTPKTNIRFAAKPNFNELKQAERLTSTETEISQVAFQMEGPAWENDLVGFRNYFDARNGIDIWGKRTHKMVLDSVGINDNYHVLGWWGMDILKVGNSLGAGAIALMIGDSVYRIGPGCKSTYKLLYEKPDQSAFELKFINWNIQGRKYTITHTITISAGTRYYESIIKLEGAKGDEYLISGIVNLHSKECLKIDGKKSIGVATHDKQAFDGEYLGMAITTPTKYFTDTLTAPNSGAGITNTYMVKMKPDANHEVRYRFYSCWEIENKNFADRKYFVKYIAEELKKGK